jgi:two-component sensor histidine kinase
MMVVRQFNSWLALAAILGALLVAIGLIAARPAGLQPSLVEGVLGGALVLALAAAAILALRHRGEPQRLAPPAANHNAGLRDALVELERVKQLAEERKVALEVADRTHAELIREVNHRIKNNLQVITSLLSLQSARAPEPDAKMALNEARQRVSALALIHRHLYDSPDFQSLDFKSFATELAQHVREAAGEDAVMQLSVRIVAPPLRIVADQAVPLALLITEAIANAIKHDFPDKRSGQITVTLTQNDHKGTLEIVDDGVGSAAAWLEAGSGLGALLVHGYARQLQGTLEVQRRTPGTAVITSFPLRSAATSADGHAPASPPPERPAVAAARSTDRNPI